MRPQGVPRGALGHVCGLRRCVIVVRDSVIGHAPPCLQHFGRMRSLRLEKVLCGVCMWEVVCDGHSEAVQSVHGLLVAGVVPVRSVWGVVGSQAMSWVRRIKCFLDVGCVYVGVEGCVFGEGGGSLVLLDRAGLLSGVRL